MWGRTFLGEGIAGAEALRLQTSLWDSQDNKGVQGSCVGQLCRSEGTLRVEHSGQGRESAAKGL